MKKKKWNSWGVGVIRDPSGTEIPGGLEGLIRRTTHGGGMDIFWNHTFGTAIPPSCLVIADHLSARSLSVTWNVINFACKRGVGRQHTTFTSCQNAAFSNEFCLWRQGRLCPGGFSFNWENVIFCTYFILRGHDMHIDFLRLLFLVGMIFPLIQKHSLRLKKLIQCKSSARRCHV